MFGHSSHEEMRSGQAAAGGTKLSLTRVQKHHLVEQFRHFDIFADCTDDDLAALVEAGKPFTVPAHWALVIEGDAADSFFAITRGHARVYRDRRPVGEIDAGSLVGEVGVLAGTPRCATVTSSTRLAGLRVGNDAIVDLVVEHPRLLEAIRTAGKGHHSAEREGAPQSASLQ